MTFTCSFESNTGRDFNAFLIPLVVLWGVKTSTIKQKTNYNSQKISFMESYIGKKLYLDNVVEYIPYKKILSRVQISSCQNGFMWTNWSMIINYRKLIALKSTCPVHWLVKIYIDWNRQEIDRTEIYAPRLSIGQNPQRP